MATAELGFLGLTHNPFVDTGEKFYPGGQRKRLLDQLSHLSQWSRRSLMVTGVPGSGKTTLCDHLAKGMEPRGKSAKIPGEVATSKRDVLAAAAQGFGVSVPDNANAEILYELVCADVAAEDESGQLCVILVDDAHRLDSRAIETLLRISLEHKVRLVLFSEPSANRMVEEIGAKLEIACHNTQLIGFGQADVRGYLDWRFDQAGYRGRIPFTDSQVETIAKVSSGLPGRIDELAGQELARLNSGENPDMGPAFPMAHRLLVGMLVLVFGLLYLLVSRSVDESPLPTDATVLAGQPLTTIEVTPTERSVRAPAPGPANRPTSVESIPKAADTPVVASAAMKPAEGPGSEDPSHTVATPLPNPREARRDNVPLPALPNARPAATLESVRNTPATKVSKPTTVPQKAAAPKEAQSEAKADAKVQKPKSNPIKPKVELKTAVAKPAQKSSQPATQAERWLLIQDPQAYTLQLFTLSSAEAATRFITKQDVPSDFATYSFSRQGKRLFVVVHGVFPSRAAATAAASSLPAAMGADKPWIRPLGQIQKTIR